MSKNGSAVWPWAVCVLLLLATMLNYMDRQALAVTLPTLKEQYHLAEGRIGILEGCFGISFAIGAILFGFLADRLGPRFLYPAVLIGWSLAGIATGFAGHTWITSQFETSDDLPGAGVFRWLVMCRVLLGICEAGHWPCALLTVRAILTIKHRTLGNGILQSGASIGAILVPIYIEGTDRLGFTWAFPFWSIGVAGFLWVIPWFLLIGRQNLSLPKEDEVSARSAPDAGGLTQRLIVLAIVVATLTISWQFLRAWLVLFLQDHHGYPKETTRFLSSGYFVASDIGCILSGVLVARLVVWGWRLHSSRLIGYFVFTLLTACGALVPFVGDGWVMIMLLFLAGGGILGLHPYFYSLAQELSVKHMGLLLGLLAAGGWVVSSLSQIYLGQHIETTQSYQLGLLIVGLAPTLGFIALLLLWPTKPPEPVTR